MKQAQGASENGIMMMSNFMENFILRETEQTSTLGAEEGNMVRIDSVMLCKCIIMIHVAIVWFCK